MVSQKWLEVGETHSFLLVQAVSRGLTIPTLSGCRCVGKSGTSGLTAISIHPPACCCLQSSVLHI